MKSEKGITLISLVITIVIMLILAGVSLSMVTNGGVLDTATDAAVEVETERLKEQIGLRLTKVQTDKRGLYSKEDVYAAAKEVTGNDVFLDENTGLYIVKSKAGDSIDLTEYVNSANEVLANDVGEVSEITQMNLDEPKNLISFKVRGKDFVCEEGMTWWEWYNSQLIEQLKNGEEWRINSTGWVIIGPTGIALYETESGTEVESTDIIKPITYLENAIAKSGELRKE